MSLESLALAETGGLPIRHQGRVHDGKVRSVYWLTEEDSARLIEENDFDVHERSPLGVMITSDRISAFDVNWEAEGDLKGIPGKGASLNAISHYWFQRFDEEGLAGNHIVDVPHPLVWIVQRAEPVKVEAIARQYITGSMWRAYEQGKREFCGVELPDGLKENQRLENILFTPTTKGVIRGIEGIDEKEDVKITKEQMQENFEALGFRKPGDVDVVEYLLRQGFGLISDELERIGQLFVDTKKEFGYALDSDGDVQLIYIDEVGTPDSSRIWDAEAYENGKIIQRNKEEFRQYLLGKFNNEVLLDDARMYERETLARNVRLPVPVFFNVSEIYLDISEKITGEIVMSPENPRKEILDSLNDYGIIE